MNRAILKSYKVDMLQRMRELFPKGSLLKVRKNFMVEQGFTLVELMITLAILAIIISLAAPSFVIFINNNRVTGATNDLISSFQLARSESIKRNGTVSVQSTNASTNWGGGHRIFVDPGGNGVLDAGELVLRNVDAPHSSVTLVGTGSSISYNASGSAESTVTFTIDTSNCEAGVSRKQRSLQLNLSGSSTLTTPTVVCP